MAAIVFVSACRRSLETQKEYAWVSAPSVTLRDRVSAVYNRVGMLQNGERVEILERAKRFVRVRTESGQEGWVEQRYLESQEVYDGFQKLAREAAAAPVQGRAVTRATLNMHVTPGRDTDHLYQLKEGERVELIRRSTGERPGRPAAPVKAASPGKNAPPAAPAPNLEDWWLIRDSQRHAGWVLSRMVDLDVPLEIAQYAEGQRIVAAFVLNTVDDPEYDPKKDEAQPASAQTQPGGGASPAGTAGPKPQEGGAADHKVPQYLVVLTEPRDGQPFDYNQVRVFTWNLRKHRYETAYRERNLFGVLPVSTGSENFEKEGTLPTFTLNVQGADNQPVARKYKLNGPIVRRVLAPGETAKPSRPIPHTSRKRK
jgi:SH3-like domain-containing protein